MIIKPSIEWLQPGLVITKEKQKISAIFTPTTHGLLDQDFSSDFHSSLATQFCAISPEWKRIVFSYTRQTKSNFQAPKYDQKYSLIRSFRPSIVGNTRYEVFRLSCRAFYPAILVRAIPSINVSFLGVRKSSWSTCIWMYRTFYVIWKSLQEMEWYPKLIYVQVYPVHQSAN